MFGSYGILLVSLELFWMLLVSVFSSFVGSLQNLCVVCMLQIDCPVMEWWEDVIPKRAHTADSTRSNPPYFTFPPHTMLYHTVTPPYSTLLHPTLYPPNTPPYSTPYCTPHIRHQLHHTPKPHRIDS